MTDTHQHYDVVLGVTELHDLADADDVARTMAGLQVALAAKGYDVRLDVWPHDVVDADGEHEHVGPERS